MPANPRITVSLTPEQVQTLATEAAAAQVTPAAVVQAAVAALAEDASAGRAIRKRVKPTGWGGPRAGAGRPPGSPNRKTLAASPGRESA